MLYYIKDLLNMNISLKQNRKTFVKFHAWENYSILFPFLFSYVESISCIHIVFFTYQRLRKYLNNQTDLSLSSPIWIQILKLQLITFEIYFLYFRCPNIFLRTFLGDGRHVFMSVTISFRLNYFFKTQARENPEWFLKIFTELLYQKHVVVKDWNYRCMKIMYR